MKRPRAVLPTVRGVLYLLQISSAARVLLIGTIRLLTIV
jgi:hypothetical protein